jgi:hypothetical protein
LRLVDALQSDVEAGFPTGSMFGEIIGDALTVYLTKRYSATPPRASLVGGLPRPRLNRVLEHIHANLDRAIRLEELANARRAKTRSISRRCSSRALEVHRIRMFYEAFGTSEGVAPRLEEQNTLSDVPSRPVFPIKAI